MTQTPTYARTVPDWLPPVAGFWGDPMIDDLAPGGPEPGLDYATWDARRDWLHAHLDQATMRCFATACLRPLLPSLKVTVSGLDIRQAVRAAEQSAFGLLTAAELTAARHAFDRAVTAANGGGQRASVSNFFHTFAAAIELQTYPAGPYVSLTRAIELQEYPSGPYVSLTRTQTAAILAVARSMLGPEPGARWAAAAAHAVACVPTERLAQSKLLTLFVPPTVPASTITEDVRGLVGGWLGKWWAGVDDGLTRAVIADALQEAGLDDGDVHLRALRELPDWHVGMWPMVPGVAA